MIRNFRQPEGDFSSHPRVIAATVLASQGNVEMFRKLAEILFPETGKKAVCGGKRIEPAVRQSGPSQSFEFASDE